MATFNMPTDPSTAENYNLWRKDAVIWQKLTSVPKAKQGLALQYACKSNTRVHEAVVGINSEQVECDEGFNNVLKVLDDLFKVDAKEEEMKAYYQFEKIHRADGQTVADFINEFDSLLKKTQAHGNAMSNNLLAIKLMRAANLTKTQCDIIKASTQETDYEAIKTTMKRTFGESTGIQCKPEESISAAHIKTEPIYHQTTNEDGHQSGSEVETPEDIFYNKNKQGKYSFNKTNKKETVPGTKYMYGRNPTDVQGRITRCNICDSVNHWKSKCPDRDFCLNKTNYYNIVLYQSDLDDPQNVSTLVRETLGAAVADCGAANTCTGQKWLDLYVESLSEEDKNLVTFSSSNKSYKFGIGPSEKAIAAVKFPVYLGSKKVLLEADVLKQDLPLLLSKATMKRAYAKLNTEIDEINMLGENIKLINTSTGHYAIPLTPNKNLINHLSETPSPCVDEKVVLLSRKPNLSASEVATKLHRQFAHPSAERLIRLLNRSEYKNNQDLKNEVTTVTNSCDVCKRFKRAPSRPIVSLPVSSEFNELLAMDIKFYQGTPLLHIIDSCTRYSVATVLKSKQSKEVIDCIFKYWISIFGRPMKIISDNGGEFISDDFKAMAESMGIYITTTAAESPWSNGLCERYNQVIGESIDKIISDVNCSLTVALAWAVNAKNSLANVHGFSPAQLVFGFNPILPSVLSDKPPALTKQDYAELINNHLQAQKLGREAFIQAESSERIRRALSHKIRSSGDVKYINGDKVYFKRANDRQWHGPAVVIGQDGQFVLLRHQSSWVRVHPCRLQLLEEQQLPNAPKQLTNKQQLTDSNQGIDDFIQDTVNSDHEAQNGETTTEDQALQEVDGATLPVENEVTDDHTNSLEPVNDIQDDQLSDVEQDTRNNENDSDAPNDQLSEHLPVPVIAESKDFQQKPKASYNKAKKFTDILKPGATIKFKTFNDVDWKECSILSRSGTVRGKYPNEWNVKLNDVIQQIDFDRNVQEAQIISESNKMTQEGNKVLSMFVETEPRNNKYLHTNSYQNDDINIEYSISQNFTLEIEDMTQQAKLKELKQWKTKEVYEEIEDNGSFPLMSLKWVIKPKLIEGVQSMKARLVARGDLEEDSFRRDSPTCCKDTIRVILTFITTMKEKICSWDVKTAFLNNDNLTRDIYVKPPKEAKTLKIWKLRKTVYGLRDASRAWYLNLSEKLLMKGCSRSSVDPAFFFWKNQDMLQGVIGIYVDDLLHAGSSYFMAEVMKEIEGLFTIGSQNEEIFTYLGIELSQQKDMSVNMCIDKYINNIEEILTDCYDLPLDDPIPTELRTPVRSLVGKINWACSISRPDIAFYACQFSSKASNATLRDVQEMNKAVRYLRNNPITLNIPSFSSLEDLHLEVYCDAAYGNLAGGASQGGYVILVTDGTNRTPVAWSSHKLKRVSRSTLTAETLALADAVDAAMLLSVLISEVIYNSAKSIPIVCYTDNDSLYKAAHTSNVVDEKRLRIELGAIRESIDKNEFVLKWVSSKEQIADALTKSGVSTKKLKEAMA